jgi:hypothetical protein
VRAAHPGLPPFASVLVLNWNGARLLPACLEALFHTDYPTDAWEVVLVDNASTDGSVEEALRRFPRLRVWRNPGNWGFARGYNGAMAAAPGPYVVLLNSDTRVRPGWLRALVDAAEADSRVGAATAKLVYPPGAPNAGRIQNAGGMLLTDGSGRDRGTVFRDGRWLQEEDASQYDRQEEVFFFCGAAALQRKAALDEVGLFDERYFMYYEDLDLSWRLRLRGWKVVYVPGAVVEHLHAASSGEWSPFFTYQVDHNRPLMLLKLAPLSLALREIARYAAEAALNCARVLCWAVTRRQRGPHAARAKLQARVLLGWLRDAPGVLVERRRIQAARTVPDSEIQRWMVAE